MAWVLNPPQVRLTGQNNNSNRLLWMLGLSLTLPMILLSGPLAGYFLSYLLIERFGMPGFLTPLLMGLGLVGSGLQSFQLIKKLNQSRPSEDQEKKKEG